MNEISVKYALFVQEGFGVDDASVYFTREAPTYEATSVPVFAEMEGERIQVGEREETFVNFTPSNGPAHRRNRVNRVPLTRVQAVVEGD